MLRIIAILALGCGIAACETNDSVTAGQADETPSAITVEGEQPAGTRTGTEMGTRTTGEQTGTEMGTQTTEDGTEKDAATPEGGTENTTGTEATPPNEDEDEENAPTGGM